MPSESVSKIVKTGIHRVDTRSRLNGVDSSSSYVASSDNLVYAHRHDRSSVNTPGYRTLRLAGKLPMQPFSFYKEDSNGSVGYIRRVTRYDNGDFAENIDSGYFGSVAPGYLLAPVVNRLNARALSKLHSRLKDQDLNLGVAIGESNKTIGLFTENAKRLAGAFKQFKRGDIGGAARILGVDHTKFDRGASDTLSRRWLELQYGWKPLLSDIYGSTEALVKSNHALDRQKIVVSASETVSQSSIVNLFDGPVTQSQSSRYTVKYTLYFSQADSLHDLAALGVVNPLSVAWELVPYSFVVDWAIPIGTYLNNLDSTYGLTFLRGCKTVFRESTSVGNKSGVSYEIPGGSLTFDSNLTESRKEVEVTRSVLSDFPSQTLPSFQNPFGQFKSLSHPGDHALNALALLWAAFRG